MCFAWQAQGFRHVAKYVAGAGVREGCKNVGRRGGFEEGLKRCVSRGRRSDFALCDVDVWSLRRWNRGRVANFMSRKSYFAMIISRGSYRTSYASAQLFRGRRNTFEASTWKSLKRIGILRSSVCSTCQFWRKSRRNASFLIFKASFLKEVPQKSFVFHLESFHFEGSLAQKLRFWVAKLHFWRKSRRKASFLSFKASFFKEVPQKCFVLELQSFIFEGSLKFNWHPTHLNLKSIDNQITSISDQLQCRITWISNQLTATSFEVQINRQPKSFEAHIDWQPNHLNLNSFEADINWLSNHLHSAHPFPIGSLSLETSATALCGRYYIYICISLTHSDTKKDKSAKELARKNDPRIGAQSNTFFWRWFRHRNTCLCVSCSMRIIADV